MSDLKMCIFCGELCAQAEQCERDFCRETFDPDTCSTVQGMQAEAREMEEEYRLMHPDRAEWDPEVSL